MAAKKKAKKTGTPKGGKTTAKKSPAKKVLGKGTKDGNTSITPTECDSQMGGCGSAPAPGKKEKAAPPLIGGEPAGICGGSGGCGAG